MEDESLLSARRALERGDYGQCLRLLQPLADQHPPSSPFGGQLRLLMVTAWIGQGDTAAAQACCRSLRASTDPELRLQARDLQMILDAPALQRPANWSLTLPSLGGAEPLEGRLKSASRWMPRRDGPPEPPPPPVGPTRQPLGFAVVALVLLLVLTLLSGCLRVDTELQFPGPGRLQLTQVWSSDTGRQLPWQQRFASAVAEADPGARLSLKGDGPRQVLRSPSLPAVEIQALLARTTTLAAERIGVELPPPRLELSERNWLLGVRQHLWLELDLQPLDAVPGLDLQMVLRPVSLGAVRQAAPRPAAREGTGVRWPLATGAANRLELLTWRWSRLGLGGMVILLLLCAALALQRLRWSSGFGWPELPVPQDADGA